LPRPLAQRERRQRAPGAAWHVEHHCFNHAERSLNAGSAWLVSTSGAHATQPETVQRWCSNNSGAGVHRPPAIDRCGQAASHRNDPYLLRFPASHGATGADVKTQEARLTSEVLYQLSYVGACTDLSLGRCRRQPLS
jgi:hypothetical protein